MRVVYCKAGQSTKILEIEPDLKMMQGLVGGNIETYPYEIAPMVFVMNEEAKLQHARPNRFIAHGRDMICGDFFVAALGKNKDKRWKAQTLRSITSCHARTVENTSS